MTFLPEKRRNVFPLFPKRDIGVDAVYKVTLYKVVHKVRQIVKEVIQMTKALISALGIDT